MEKMKSRILGGIPGGYYRNSEHNYAIFYGMLQVWCYAYINEIISHGFRAMPRTILEVLEVRADFIEHQLAHTVPGPNGRAYNQTSYLSERRKMMQTWADYLDGLPCAR
jgi:integrase